MDFKDIIQGEGDTTAHATVVVVFNTSGEFSRKRRGRCAKCSYGSCNVLIPFRIFNCLRYPMFIIRNKYIISFLSFISYRCITLIKIHHRLTSFSRNRDNFLESRSEYLGTVANNTFLGCICRFYFCCISSRGVELMTVMQMQIIHIVFCCSVQCLSQWHIEEKQNKLLQTMYKNVMNVSCF